MVRRDVRTTPPNAYTRLPPSLARRGHDFSRHVPTSEPPAARLAPSGRATLTHRFLAAPDSGVAATALDPAAGCAVHSILGKGGLRDAIDPAVKMVRAVPRGVRLHATGKTSKTPHVSRTLGVSRR